MATCAALANGTPCSHWNDTLQHSVIEGILLHLKSAAVAADKPNMGPLAVFAIGWQHRKLIERLTKREIAAKYRGSLLGPVWGLLTPLLMLGVYTFLFSVVFNSRWTTPSGSQGEFALLFFSGMIVFGIFSECIVRAPGLMRENVSYIKKIVFPLEIMPIITLCVSLFNALFSFVVLALFYVILLGAPPPTLLLLPLVLLPLCFTTLGLTWFLSSVGMFLRDIQQIIGAAVTALMFLSPIFYPLSAVPDSFRWLVYLNPLTVTLETSKDVMFWGRVPDPMIWGLHLLASWLIAWMGYFWFMKTRKAFADVV